MTDVWRAKLEAGGVVLIEGGTGSELRRRGVALDARAWSGPAALSRPDTLTAIHSDYIRAGADVITTNTFGTTRFVLEAAGLGERFESINRASVDAARRACEIAGRPVAIAGSISCLPPGFDPTRYPDASAERAAYAELASLLAELGVDLLVLEMMEDTVHAPRACEAVRGVGLPFWLGVSARTGARGLVAYDFAQIPFGDVLDALLGYAPAVVNIMHTPPETVGPALAMLAEKWSGPAGAYPEVTGDSPARLAGWAGGWLRAGACVLGGCCGTTPEHVSALRRLIEQRGKDGGGGRPEG